MAHSNHSLRRRISIPVIAATLLASISVMASASASGQGEDPASESGPPQGTNETLILSAAGELSAAAAIGDTTVYEDQAGQTVYRVDDGFDLDRYLFRSSGPIDFSIDVARSFGAVDEFGHPAPGNSLFGKEGRLTLRVWDIDDDYTGTSFEPEIDQVLVNGNLLDRALSGANSQWSINTLVFPLEYLKLPTQSNPNGTNDIQVLIDTANTGSNVWAAEVDWAELRLTDALLPVAMIHGFGGDPDDFRDFETYYETEIVGLDGRVARPQLTERGSIAANVALMEQPIADLLADSGTTKTQVLAHSLGGLDTRLYAWDNPSVVNKVVMMGTPNGGTRIADILCGAQDPWWIVVGGVGWIGAKEVLEDQFGECNDENDGIFQLQQSYVQDIFNPQIPDRRSTTYLTIAGQGNDARNILLDGEDDGLVTVSSVQYLDRFNQDHPGLHNALAVFNINHTKLHDPDSETGPSSICALYVSTCDSVFSEQATASTQSLSLAAVEPFTGSMVPKPLESVELAPGESADLPVTFEGSPRASVMIFGDGIIADIDGATFEPSELFGSSILTADVIDPVDGPVTITNDGTTPAKAAMLVSLASDRRLSVTPTPSLATPGEDVTVTVELAGATPADAPVVALVDSTGTVVAEPVLVDAGGGQWLASLIAPGPGIYRIAAYVDGGAPRWVTDILSVGGVAASLQGTFGVSVVDTNSNSLYDELRVSVDVDVVDAGEYRVAAVLLDDVGNAIGSAGVRSQLAAGSNSIDLVFSGQEIYASGTSGPYTVAEVVLSTGGLRLEDFVPTLGTTAAYDYRSFEHFPVLIDRDSFTDSGVDVDDDDLYDELQVTGSVDVDNAGTYAINARLVAGDRTELGEFSTSAFLDVGTNEFTMTFPWTPIRDAEINGPYAVEDLSIYPLSANDVLGYLVLAHTTAAYDSTGDVGRVTFESLRAQIDAFELSGDIDNRGIARSLGAKLNAAEASVETGNIETARNQLDALRSELWAQRGKHISEIAYLELDADVAQLATDL